ncbi:natural cytotoxicity triggering receptor 3 ligand 1-like [Ascaphus truei]|uniref:natural cytotoxicity triggering receptor 3 ligand 1-like n=1 Tax=Ascaphus truei TaxID=8439 RepID=UPI003F590F3A
MAFRGHQLPLVLCLIIMKVCSHVSEERGETVIGELHDRVTLHCPYLSPDDWDGREARVLWFRNLTEKILDCPVKEGERLTCEKNAYSHRTRLSPAALCGDASLEISHLQGSDAGAYQCWVILSQTYHRGNLVLRVQGVMKDVIKMDESSPHEMSTWNMLETKLPVKVLAILMSGWLIALLLVGILVSQRFFLRESRRKYMISI